MPSAKAKKETGDSDRQFVSALAKGLEVLQCFTVKTPELGVSDIARLTGMPQPTVWRLCHTLLELGFLTPSPGRPTLRPGIPVLGLGYALLSTMPIGELALPEMLAIAKRYEGAVSLGARDGLSMIYLQRCQGSAIVLADLRVGSRVPMATSATGWAYLAGLDAEPRRALLDELRAKSGPEWQAVETRFSEALKGFQRHGFIVNTGSLHPRINSVAVPLRAQGVDDHLSLSAGGIREVFTEEVIAKVGEELKALATQLSRCKVSPSASN